MSCKLLVSPPSHFTSLPFPSLFCPPHPPQNVWIDLNGVIVTALPAVCLSASLESLTWAEGKEEGKRQRERERGESSFEQQGMAALQRARASVRSQSPLKPVPFSIPLSICSQSLLLFFSHTVFLDNLFPAERPIFNSLSTVSHFESMLLLLFLPLNLSTLTCFLSLLV